MNVNATHGSELRGQTYRLSRSSIISLQSILFIKCLLYKMLPLFFQIFHIGVFLFCLQHEMSISDSTFTKQKKKRKYVQQMSKISGRRIQGKEGGKKEAFNLIKVWSKGFIICFFYEYSLYWCCPSVARRPILNRNLIMVPVSP